MSASGQTWPLAPFVRKVRLASRGRHQRTWLTAASCQTQTYRSNARLCEQRTRKRWRTSNAVQTSVEECQGAPTTSSQNGSTPKPGMASRASPGNNNHCRPSTKKAATPSPNLPPSHPRPMRQIAHCVVPLCSLLARPRIRRGARRRFLVLPKPGAKCRPSTLRRLGADQDKDASSSSWLAFERRARITLPFPSARIALFLGRLLTLICFGSVLPCLWCHRSVEPSPNRPITGGRFMRRAHNRNCAGRTFLASNDRGAPSITRPHLARQL
jgi:hypothetical protein